ncbi:hypothetical protein [Salinisphaera sp.]|uniref:hypothetical protein n=1 Tax=Salinisphaera sp. TaxID=1914330 RepID=UPI002D78CC16|nr:hypothetical protein [Salinisphaera sp.]HET7313580.1 hypothetical protein [Salinisphaera sp.]
MNTFKLNIVNSLVVAGLVAASMAMPIVAAELAQAPGAQNSAPVAAQIDDADAIR